MTDDAAIITIAAEPCWDITCYGRDLDWSRHEKITGQDIYPAGKALNVSRALAWLSRPSTAAGLWGSEDHTEALRYLASLKGRLKTAFTVVPGRTRRNITIIDTFRCREMHLRCSGQLADVGTLRKLRRDLGRMVKATSVCVFAGSMGTSTELGAVCAMIRTCRDRRAGLVLDTSGPALKAMVEMGGILLVKPNVAELSELLGEHISDTPAGLVRAGRRLLDQTEHVLISRGRAGAILVTKGAAWSARCRGRQRKAHCTVGCGDYLLAGFLNGLVAGRPKGRTLETAVKVAAARAWGLTEQMKPSQVTRQIEVELRRLS